MKADLIGTWSTAEEAWHQARRTGVSSSEIAALMGLSRWESAFSLYWHKLGQLPPTPDNPAMALGRYLEPWVAQQFAQMHPEFAVLETGTWRSRDRPWQLCNPDRLLHGIEPETREWSTVLYTREPTSLLEIKTDASYEGWGEDGSEEIPVKYRCQVLWQLDCLGLTQAWVCCLFLHTRKIRTYQVEWDPDDVAVMREAAADFLDRLERRDPPPVDYLPVTTGALKALHPKLEDREADVPAAVAVRYHRAVLGLREAEKDKRHAENLLRQAMGDARVAVRGDARVATRSVYELPAKTIERAACTVDRLIPAKGEPE